MIEWKTVEQAIAEDDAGKWDRVASAGELRIAFDGSLELGRATNGQQRLALSELAQGQLCGRLGIPARYYRRLPAALKAAVANHDFERLHENTYLLRGKDAWIRAFLSSDYVAYNNAHVAETVQELLNGANVSAKSFVLEETHLYLKVVSEEIVQHDFGLKAGVMIGNSEVGLGSVSVEPFVFRLACTNDLVVSKEQSFRHPHTRLTVHELRLGAALAISIAFEVAASVLDRFLKTREEPLRDPVETIRHLAEARSMSRKFADEVVSSYASEPEATRFGVINAFSRAAQTLAPLERIEVERFAGSLLDAAL